MDENEEESRTRSETDENLEDGAFRSPVASVALSQQRDRREWRGTKDRHCRANGGEPFL